MRPTYAAVRPAASGQLVGHELRVQTALFASSSFARPGFLDNAAFVERHD